jgi:hypothetical protein
MNFLHERKIPGPHGLLENRKNSDSLENPVVLYLVDDDRDFLSLMERAISDGSHMQKS